MGVQRLKSKIRVEEVKNKMERKKCRIWYCFRKAVGYLKISAGVNMKIDYGIAKNMVESHKKS